MSLRLGILLSGGGRTMVNLVETIERGELDAEIAVVISSRSAVAGVQRAEALGIEPHIVRKKDLPDMASFTERLVEILTDAKVDLICQCGWLCLWEVPAHYANRVLNIHPALLPAFGGKGMWGHHVHEAVIAAGAETSGCTVHFVNNEYDTGPIILQKACPVLPGDDADALAARIFALECQAYPQAVKLFGQGRLVVRNGRVFITSDVPGSTG